MRPHDLAPRQDTASARYQLSAILTLAAVTGLTLVRSHLLWIAAGIGLFGTLAGYVGGAVSIFAHGRIVADFSLSAMHLTMLAVAIGAGQGIVAQDLDGQGATVVLAHPLGRGAWLVGRYVGLWAILSLQVVVMALMTYAMVAFLGATLPPSYGSAVGLMPLVGAVVGALAMVFACAASRPIALAGTLVFLSAGYGLDAVMDFLAKKSGLAVEVCRHLIQTLVPQMQRLSLQAYVANAQAVPPHYFAVAAVYAASYSGAVLILGRLILNYRRAI
jgi:hypothetical protein